jgi:hypothetical protein
MNSVVVSALASALTKLSKTMPVPVGRHAVNETVILNVSGEVLKCDDENYIPTVHIPIKTVLAFLLPSLGATRKVQQRKLLDACNRALAADVKMDETIREIIKDIDAAFSIVQNEVTSKLTPETRQGKTIPNCSVTEVDPLTVKEIASELNKTSVSVEV